MTCEVFFQPPFTNANAWYAAHDHRVVSRLLPSESDHQSYDASSSSAPITEDDAVPPLMTQPLQTPTNTVSRDAKKKDDVGIKSKKAKSVSKVLPKRSDVKPANKNQRILSDMLQPVPEDSSSEDEAPLTGPQTSFQRDARWWFEEETHKLRLACVHPHVHDQTNVRFADKKIVGFRNMFYIARMKGGAAVGNPRICREFIKRNLPLPPLLDRKQHLTEAQCETHIKKTFEHVWFVTVYAHDQKAADDTFDDELVKFSDLVDVNNTKDLRTLMTDMCKLLTPDNTALRKFLLLSLERVFRHVS